MANNRMYLVCVRCISKEETKIEDCRACVAKYYPSSGWYDTTEGTAMKEFLNRHSHGSMYGEDITLVYESVFGGFAQDKREILDIMQEHVEKVQNGEIDNESDRSAATDEQGKHLRDTLQ
jgi:hypothetical protein